MSEKKTISKKIVLLGDTAVGKSSSVERFVKDEFFEFQQPTIGAAFLTQNIPLDDCIIKFEIWDTAGQERYRSLAPMYYRGAAAALVVYDITSSESFTGAQNWIDELQRQGSEDIIIGLAGNKMDLESRREIQTEDAARYAADHGCVFYETSAKTGQNVSNIFTDIAKRLPKEEANAQGGGQQIQIIQAENSKKGCC